MYLKSGRPEKRENSNRAFVGDKFGVLCLEHVCWPPISGVRSRQNLGMIYEGLSAAHALSN